MGQPGSIRFSFAASKSARGFTLVELLAVLTVIALLASLVLPALSRAKSKAAQASCRNNSRQIGLAFLTYFGDFNDVFPTGAPKSALGAQPEDWVWWQNVSAAGGSAGMRDASRSALSPYFGGHDHRYLRCPADKDALTREATWKRNPTVEQYTFSYSLNAFDERGMASYISADRSMIFLNRHSSVNRPSEKIMLAEERGGAGDGPGSAIIDDGRWLPAGYPLTMRHSKKANVTFGDGHVATVSRGFADSDHPENYDPRL